MPVLLDEQLKATGAAVLSLCHPYLTAGFIIPYLDRGLECIAWTIDDPEEMKRTAAIDQRIAICTNHPERWYEHGTKTAT